MTPPEPLRTILMTTDTVGGVWNYSLTLIRRLASHGVEVVLATMGPRPNDAQRNEVAALPNVTLRESEFRLEWMENSWADLEEAGAWLLDLERRFAPDIVHLNGYVHGALPWTAPVMIVAHSCVVSWWQALRGRALPPEWESYRGAVRSGLHAADSVIAPTQAMLDTLLANYGPLACARVIPNGCDRALFGREAKEPVVLSVGRVWDEAKNIRILADVAPDLAWPVRIAGETKGPDSAEVGVANVDALGFCSRDQLAREFARASIYVLPARYEPFGLSILEAALSGCALVLGDIPSLRENWDGAAVFVPPLDRVRLHASIAALIERTAWRAELAAASRERALRFSDERMALTYLETYRGLRHRGRAAGREALTA